MYSKVSTLPTIYPFVAPSKDSTDFSLLEEGREAEPPGVPQCFPTKGIGYTAAGCFSLSCDTMMCVQMSQRN